MDSTFWNNRFAQEIDLYGTEPNKYFKEKIADLRPGRLLVPGEGEGRQAVYAATKGWQVTAFDMSDTGRNHALEKAKELKVQLDYQLATAGDFTYEGGAYDCAALIYFHLPPDIRPAIHKKIAGALKPGGHLIIEGFHPKQLGYSSGGPKKEEMLYTVEMLRNDFEGFTFLEALEGEVFLTEGRGHHGHAYVSRLFARKSL